MNPPKSTEEDEFVGGGFLSGEGGLFTMTFCSIVHPV